MASETLPHADPPLTGARKRTPYNDAERQFSLIVQERLQEVLQGKRNSLALMRRYPADPDRLGIMTTPPDLPREELRLSVAEALTWEAISFVCSETAGGPIAQQVQDDGSVVELQMFTTKYPHIVIQRTDRFADGADDPLETTWTLSRVQNQRTQTQVNRLLDAANLALELLKVVR